jgi:hypothetical protein
MSALPCAVCSRDGALPRQDSDGGYCGKACEGECTDLLLEAARLQKNGTEYEIALILSRWQRRRAENPSDDILKTAPKPSGLLALELALLKAGE